MKNKKFILGVCLCFLLVLGVCIFLFIPQNSKEGKKEEEPKKETELMKFIGQDIDLSKVTYLEIVKLTEGGDIHTEVTDQSEIETYYSKLEKVKVTEETDMACDDNTTIFIFYMNDDTKVSIEFECEFLVFNNKRYLVK